MAVHKKLMQARIKLQSMELKKSGENKFAGYKYFELGDFLPQTMQIFYDLELASVVSFDQEFARLCITDTEDNSAITITSPMADAQLKGAHPIQNLGAVESYQRRYLWLAAMEIVEHDILDAEEPSSPKLSKPSPPPNPSSPPKPPVRMVGTDGSWKIDVRMEPGSDIQGWLGLVSDACDIALGMANTEEDVMTIFKRNKAIFDKVKEVDAAFFKEQMAKFSTTKTNLKAAQE